MNWTKALLGIAVLVLVVCGACYLWPNSPRGGALVSALLVVADAHDTPKAAVANLILMNYQETRLNAQHWSTVYWGFTFAAAILSAFAAIVLKLETLIKSEGAKKDIAALCAVAAALLITISTSGDFQRKWQANRIAAAELEREGYRFLKDDGADPRSHLDPVGDILLRRQLAIVGGTEQRGLASKEKADVPEKPAQ